MNGSQKNNQVEVKWVETITNSLRSGRFLPSPGRDRTSERKSRRVKKHTWGEQKIGKKWRGWGEKKSPAVNPKHFIYQTLFGHEQGAVVQFDWLLACQ